MKKMEKFRGRGKRIMKMNPDMITWARIEMKEVGCTLSILLQTSQDLKYANTKMKRLHSIVQFMVTVLNHMCIQDTST